MGLKLDISISLDGFVAGPNQSLEEPLGVGGELLHEWVTPTEAFREQHGGEGGETGIDDEVTKESLAGIRATIMGRHMFSGGSGPWQDDPRAFGLTLHVVPVFLGGGARLFENHVTAPPANLELVGTVASPTGAVHLTYRPF